MSDVISKDLKAILKRLKLSPITNTLPERATLARQRRMAHLDFLELVLADEVSRRDALSATLRAQRARLDPGMMIEAWDDSAKVNFDRDLWADITTLRFMDDRHNVIVMGPVGVGKTFMANALGHIACHRKRSASMVRSDQMFKRLKAARLDHSYEQELRRLICLELLIIDDFGLRDLDDTETQDFYDLVVERHLKASTVISSNRDPASGSRSWPIRCSLRARSTGCRARPTSSWSRASPIADAENLRLRVGQVDGSRKRQHHHLRPARGDRDGPMFVARPRANDGG